jgi:hypothetical protein
MTDELEKCGRELTLCDFDCKRKITKMEAEIKALRREFHNLAKAVIEPAVNKDERYYQEILERHLGGGHLYIKHVGITDVTTTTEHAEIKRWTQANHAVGQLLSYNAAVPREKLSLYFFGPSPSPARFATIMELCAKHKIDVYSLDEKSDQITAHERTTNLVEEFLEEKVARSDLHWIEVKSLARFEDWVKPKTTSLHQLEELKQQLRTRLGTPKRNSFKRERWIEMVGREPDVVDPKKSVFLYGFPGWRWL